LTKLSGSITFQWKEWWSPSRETTKSDCVGDRLKQCLLVQQKVAPERVKKSSNKTKEVKLLTVLVVILNDAG